MSNSELRGISPVSHPKGVIERCFVKRTFEALGALPNLNAGISVPSDLSTEDDFGDVSGQFKARNSRARDVNGRCRRLGVGRDGAERQPTVSAPFISRIANGLHD